MLRWQGLQVKEQCYSLINKTGRYKTKRTSKNFIIMAIRFDRTAFVAIVAGLVYLQILVAGAFGQEQSVSVTDNIIYCPTPMGSYLLVQTLGKDQPIVQLGYRNTSDGKFKWEKIIGQISSAA